MTSLSGPSSLKSTIPTVASYQQRPPLRPRPTRERARNATQTHLPSHPLRHRAHIMIRTMMRDGTGRKRKILIDTSLEAFQVIRMAYIFSPVSTSHLTFSSLFRQTFHKEGRFLNKYRSSPSKAAHTNSTFRSPYPNRRVHSLIRGSQGCTFRPIPRLSHLPNLTFVRNLLYRSGIFMPSFPSLRRHAKTGRSGCVSGLRILFVLPS